MSLRQTKTVASISDRRCDVNSIKELFDARMNVIRINTAHASHEGSEVLVASIRTVSSHIAILMNTKSPEVHTTANAESMLYQIGEKVKTVEDPEREATRECTAISYPNFIHDLNVSGTALVDDGDLRLRAIDKTSECLLCEIQNEVTLGNRKSVNVPGIRISLPSLTEKDRDSILYVIEKDIDLITHSFVHNRWNILDIREVLDAHNSSVHATTRTGNQEGIDNIDEIPGVADEVMVARGDLGIEIPQKRIPGIQCILTRKRTLAKKLVIVATQMLHTMVNNPCLTRAEVTNVANAIYYRTDALILSGETAYGKYLVEAVRIMTKIAAQAKKGKLEGNDIRIPLDKNNNDMAAFLARQAVKMTTKLKICVTITDGYQGRTARNLVTFHGRYPVLAVCYKKKAIRHLTLPYGVGAVYMPESANGQEYYFAALRRLLKEGRLYPIGIVGYLGSGKAGIRTPFLEVNVVENTLKHTGNNVLPNNNRYLWGEMKKTGLLDEYILRHIDEEGEYLKALYRDTHVKLLCPCMTSGHLQGHMLKIFVRVIRPHQVLEIGTYSGCSVLCLAKGFKKGRMLHTFKINDEQEGFTRPWLEDSVYADRIRFYIRDAPRLIPALGVTLNLAFVDGDKRRYIEYYEVTPAYLSPGGYTVTDGTLWDGYVLREPHNSNYQTIGTKAFSELVTHDERAEKVIPLLRGGPTIIYKE